MKVIRNGRCRQFCLLQYLESHVGRDAGRQLYESLCANAVNQAIGRVIRHRRDYAAVILIDERYAKKSIHDQLPSWIRSRLVVASTFGQTLGHLRNFFQRIDSSTP